MLLLNFIRKISSFSRKSKVSLVTHVTYTRNKWLSLIRSNSRRSIHELHECLNEKMTNDKGRKYEDAIKALNGLQSNAATIAKMQKETNKKMQTTSILDMEKFLFRIGIDVNKLDQLNIVHVSGTKGKGSVCAFCESILRMSGLKTGFYSSPHLVEVRERIRIDGKPLSHDMFTKYFFQVYDKLVETAVEFKGDMPGYFRFLTLMAFHVYLEQKVDVAVFEVGIGGSYDCTNVVRRPTVCGITKLEIDHASVLGRTIKEIAWHKAGIMKPGRPALTVPQREEAEEILFGRSVELNTNLYRIPSLSDYQESFPEFGIKGEHQLENAAMALQLARVWFHEQKNYVLGEKREDILKSTEWKSVLLSSPFAEEKYPRNLNTFQIPDVFLTGLKETQWQGRCQIIQKKSTTFFLDGAHTIGSTKACVQWFKKESEKRAGKKMARVLCFFITGDRDHQLIMNKLKEINFDFVIFCPTIQHAKSIDTASDLTNFNISRDTRLKKCDELQRNWLQVIPNKITKEENPGTCSSFLENSDFSSAVFPSISSAIRWIAMGREPDIGDADDAGPDYPMILQESDHMQVLVSGSLHLVGGVLKFLGPAVDEDK